MPAAKKTEAKKRPSTSKKTKSQSTEQPKKSEQKSKKQMFKATLARLKSRIQNYLTRRPHRSFRRTRRRDYVRTLKMPGYLSFTLYVLKTIGSRKALFAGLVIFYAALTSIFVGLVSQDTYAQLRTAVSTSGSSFFGDGLGELGKAGVLLFTSVTGGLTTPSTGTTATSQQVVVSALVFLMTWLATVWLLRSMLTGQKPRLRDGLYNSGAPIISTLLVSLVLAVQLIPFAIAAIGISIASTAGYLSGGVEAMVFWLCALLLVGLSLYWVTSTLIALVVVTLPGMYPMKALQIAGDLVIGRRIRILFRILWSLLFSVSIFVIVMIPVILFDGWIKQLIPAIANFAIVPVALLTMGALVIVWLASYVYLLYRKVVDDDAAPA